MCFALQNPLALRLATLRPRVGALTLELMAADNTEDDKGGRKRLRKAIYKRNPDKPEEAPKKPEELVRGKSRSIRFTASEWAGIVTKATLAGTTPTNIVRAGALGLKMQAVVSREWTPEERVDYRALVNGLNNLNQLTKSVNLLAHERGQVAELYAWMRPLLAALVPARIEQKEDGI